MEKQLNVYEAKTRFSELIERAGKGETFIVAKNGKPTAHIIPATQKKTPKKRKLGVSSLRIVERNRKKADAEIAAQLENGSIWPDT